MRSLLTATILAATVSLFPVSGHAETLRGALANAYNNNSELNSARAGVRVRDENVPLAKSGYRPRVTGSAGITSTTTAGAGTTSSETFGVTINQSLFDGFQTLNNVRSAKAGVAAERENLRNTEQNVLFDTVQAYMDVIQNRRIAALRQQNLGFLDEQVRAANARFEVGEGTRTDVEQARASRAGAQAQLTAARAAAESSMATLQQLTGSSDGNLASASPVSRGLPSSLSQAQAIAMRDHPAILLRQHLIDSGLFSVKSAEGAFLPQLGLQASVNHNSTQNYQYTGRSGSANSATIGAQVTIPIYQGGAASATVRQRKEQLGQARIDEDVARDQVRAAVTSAWSQLEASRAATSANYDSVRAAQSALNGVIQERDVGQRTTLDVLTAQSTVVSAQILQVQAERNAVVSSYALLSAMGQLSAERLGLAVKPYEPRAHYEAVVDKWYGLRTPDGR